MNDAAIDSTGARKLNCWEFKKCGRELGGVKTFELGVCPATTNLRLDNVHGGKSAGRGCWVVAGTLCGGVVHGTFSQKYRTCGQCDFYEYVKTEEGENLMPTMKLLKMLE
ncbi:MAG: hypothetical protein HZA15_03320 [Nitrospirae bacterium]|nr:hypothetical protein [Nitrospirota bacterium]